MATCRIGTRGSALALWQARHIAARLAALHPALAIEIVELVSTGDQVTNVPLSDVEGTGFFTSTIERALLDGRVDVAVHSHKDLPVAASAGLRVAAVPARGLVQDVLCARDGLTLATLPPGARLGTCSARRTAQVRAVRDDLDLQPLRGNVPTRVGRVTGGELDAIILAQAGLDRLGLQDHITETFGIAAMLPAPAQGALAVQCRAADVTLAAQLAALDDRDTRQAVEAERTVLHALGGGCSVPVGALAVSDDGRLTLRAAAFALDGKRVVRADAIGTDPTAVGEAVARRLLDEGAGAILAEFEKRTRLDWPRPSGAEA